MDSFSHISLLHRIHECLNKFNFPPLCLKVKQIKCLDFALQKKDVLAVLPTGYGKSLIFHLLPFVFPLKKRRNFIIVVAPLTSIIKDQVATLHSLGIEAKVLSLVKEDVAYNSLFDESVQCGEDDQKKNIFEIPKSIREGEMDILFSHPEDLLCEKGRKLLKSKTFRDNVVAIVIDEAHCVDCWGQDFRTEFQELSSLKALFHEAPVIGLTATAPPDKIDRLKAMLCFDKNSEVIVVNPNRKTIFLSKIKTISSNFGNKRYDDILLPIAKCLLEKRKSYPMTIIYMKLKYCGYAYSLFENVLKDDQYVDDCSQPSHRLFCQFHAPQTKGMKDEILKQIVNEDSNIRVIFATTALGMGVNAPFIKNVIHITPPTNLESYFQEIGRAGRSSNQATATLYYNNNDISSHKVHLEKSMRDYCASENQCLRSQILSYFGHQNVSQKNCCSVCVPMPIEICTDKATDIDEIVLRDKADDDGITKLKDELKQCIIRLNEINLFAFDNQSLCLNKVEKMVLNLESITSANVLLFDYGIWDESISNEMFSLIQSYMEK